jgi:uncharacterized membrane protein (UPF0127 family)
MEPPMRHILTISILLLATLSGCASSQPWVELRGQRYVVEVADTHEERARGLMFRDRLEPGTGMLFVHDTEQPLAYWMKNTKIPLDILYFDEDRKLVSVSRGVPPCLLGNRCPNYPSRGPALYVLELNAGVASQIGVAPGDELTISPGIAERGAP